MSFHLFNYILLTSVYGDRDTDCPSFDTVVLPVLVIENV